MYKILFKPLIMTAALALLAPIHASALTKIQPNVPVNIKKLPDAQVFAQFTDKLPAVLNYFTSASEKEVITFYQQAYGQVIQQNKKRGRLTLYFAHNKQTVRVVVSTQDRKRQVDILMSNQLKAHQD